MKLNLIHLTSPVGKIAIVTEYIVAVAEVHPGEAGANNTFVRTKIYASPDGEAYNVLEKYDDVIKMLS